MPNRRRPSRQTLQVPESKSERTTGRPRRIPADISRQAPHNSYGGVPLYYEDREFACVDCGKVEVWTATQQKWWYETAKGYIFSQAIRCRACRAKIRERHAGTPRKSHQERWEQQQAKTAAAETPVVPPKPQRKKRLTKRHGKYPRKRDLEAD